MSQLALCALFISPVVYAGGNGSSSQASSSTPANNAQVVSQLQQVINTLDNAVPAQGKRTNIVELKLPSSLSSMCQGFLPAAQSRDLSQKISDFNKMDVVTSCGRGMQGAAVFPFIAPLMAVAIGGRKLGLAKDIKATLNVALQQAQKPA